MTFDSPVTSLNGVGDAKAKSLAKLGITTVGDLIHHIPRAYQNRGNITPSALADKGDEPVSMILTVSAEPSVSRLRRELSIVKFRAFDESGTVAISFFNQPYLKDIFHTGSTFRFWGKVEKKRHRFK